MQTKGIPRRQFLAGALALIGSRSLPLRAAPSSTQQPMTLGFSTYGMKTFSTREAIKAVAGIGFDSVELCVTPDWDANPLTFSQSRRQEVARQLGDHGLILSSLMEQLHIDDDLTAKSKRIDRIKRAAELGHDLSPNAPPLMQTTLGGKANSTIAWRKTLVNELQEWARTADEHDLRIAIKPHRGGGLSRPDDAVALLRELNLPPQLSLCYDYSHYALRDMTPEQTVRDAMPFVSHIAVKDVEPYRNSFRFRLPGETGQVPHAALLKYFSVAGYRGDVCCEPSGQVWSQPGYDPIAAAKICYQNMFQAFQKAGLR